MSSYLHSDDWGLPISNPNNFHEGRNLCRPWLVAINLFAVILVVSILVHGGPDMDYASYSFVATNDNQHYYQGLLDPPETKWESLGKDLVGPIPNNKHRAAVNRLVGFGHHVAMNEEGDRIAIARTSRNPDMPGEVFVYSRKDAKHTRNDRNNWRLEQVISAELTEDDKRMSHTGQQHTPLAMSASGHRIAFTEGDHVFVFESLNDREYWRQIAKVHPMGRDHEDAKEKEGLVKKEKEELEVAEAEAEALETKYEATATASMKAAEEEKKEKVAEEVEVAEAEADAYETKYKANKKEEKEEVEVAKAEAVAGKTKYEANIKEEKEEEEVEIAEAEAVALEKKYEATAAASIAAADEKEEEVAKAEAKALETKYEATAAASLKVADEEKDGGDGKDDRYLAETDLERNGNYFG